MKSINRNWIFRSAVITAALLIIIGFIGYLIHLSREKTNEPAFPAKPHSAYNILLDSVRIEKGKVPQDATLSTLLSTYLPASMIDRAARSSRDTFDVRRIKAGNPFAVITTKDSARRILYFIYEINNIDYVVFDFRDSLRYYSGKKHVTKVETTTSGTIESSLWNTFADRKLDQNLGLALADIFAWTVDFYGLKKGDAFKILFEEFHVEDGPTGSYRIIAAVFHSNGKDFYAFQFIGNGKGEYFDEKGNSLRKSFLKAPLRFSRISSRFSRSRKHPVLRISRPHYGVDYAAPKGTPVVALGDGRVVEANWKGGYGRFISIRHNSVYTSTYAHLSGYAKGIKPGVHVSQGDVIGYVGSSGLSTGPHLDFRVYRNGSPADPLKIESPSSEPVPASVLPGYLIQSGKLRQRMDSIRF